MRRQLLISPERHVVPEAICDAKDAVGEQAMTVWVYVNTSKHVGDRDHVKVFAKADAGKRGFRKTTRKASRSNTRFWSEPLRLDHLYGLRCWRGRRHQQQHGLLDRHHSFPLLLGHVPAGINRRHVAVAVVEQCFHVVSRHPQRLRQGRGRPTQTWRVNLAAEYEPNRAQVAAKAQHTAARSCRT